jgi:pimeloyl-ACP methyl ester carboxylesterase
VAVRGSGPDVILIPGLSASRGIWSSTVAAVPGYRYHLVQVAGFAGTAPAAIAGRVAAPSRRRSPLHRAQRLGRRRSSAIRWADRSR